MEEQKKPLRSERRNIYSESSEDAKASPQEHSTNPGSSVIAAHAVKQVGLPNNIGVFSLYHPESDYGQCYYGR